MKDVGKKTCFERVFFYFLSPSLRCWRTLCALISFSKNAVEANLLAMLMAAAWSIIKAFERVQGVFFLSHPFDMPTAYQLLNDLFQMIDLNFRDMSKLIIHI